MSQAHSVLQFNLEFSDVQEESNSVTDVHESDRDETDAPMTELATLPIQKPGMLKGNEGKVENKKDPDVIQRIPLDILKLKPEEIIKCSNKSALRIRKIEESGLGKKDNKDDSDRDNKDVESLSSSLPNLIKFPDFFGLFKNTIQSNRTLFVKQLNKAHSIFLKDFSEIKPEEQRDFKRLLLEKIQLLIEQQKTLDELLTTITSPSKEMLSSITEKINEMTTSLSAIENLLKRPDYAYAALSAEEERLLSCLPNYLTVFTAVLYGALLGLLIAYSPLGIMLAAKIGGPTAIALLMGTYAFITGGCSVALVYYCANPVEKTSTLFRPASTEEKKEIEPIINTGKEFLSNLTLYCKLI